MDLTPPPPDVREKLQHWVQDALRLLPHLPPLLHVGEGGARTTDLERECEKLRKDLDELRKEHEKLRADRDELAQAFSKLVEFVQPLNQIAQKMGVRRSPFAAHPAPAAPAAAAAPPPPGPTPGSTPKPS